MLRHLTRVGVVHTNMSRLFALSDVITRVCWLVGWFVRLFVRSLARYDFSKSTKTSPIFLKFAFAKFHH